jgi:PAS domain S-box-containing protein
VSRSLRLARTLFLATACVIFASAGITYLSGLRVIRLHNQALYHSEALRHLEDILSAVKDAETGQRGFIITGDEKYLEPYKTALARLPAELREITDLEAAHIPNEDLAQLRTLVASKLNELDKTITMVRHQGMQAAEAFVRTGAGKVLMDQIRASAGRIAQEQQAKLQWDVRKADEATRLRSGVFALTSLLSVAFIAWCYRRIRRAVKAEEAAARQAQAEQAEAERQRELLKVTLSSIGDSVIVTDTGGRITFMNGVAETQTGWSFAEANLRPAHEVFRIINEETRAPVENPVEKVLTTGVVVGLANHTVLIRKDGTEIPIDDSGAPIREPDGTLRGAVLVFRDFTEHKNAQAQLHAAKEAAEAANRAKDQFLAILSHELRTPLTPVLATLNLWEGSDDLPSGLRADLPILKRNIELEARIIDDLLDLTRITRGMLSFTREDADVNQIIELVLGMCRPELQRKQLRVLTDFHAVQHHVHTDVSRLQQILWNILSNAAKFTEAGGTITVHTSNDARGVLHLTITDTGIGMAEETLTRLFMPFEQGERQLSRRYGGLGLGMAISRALVDLLGGKISAHSDGLGQGSSFTVSFPTCTPTIDEPSFDTHAGRAPQALLGLRILLVEDHADTATALARLLTRRGYEVHVAETVAAALQTAQKECFDLLLSDLGLPDGTGFEVVEKVHAIRRVPALALSGYGMEEDIRRCQDAGFDAHLTKPVNFQNLDTLILKLTAPDESAPSVN